VCERERETRARRAVQTWAAWGPSGGTAETEKKNGIVGPPGAIKLRGPPEAAAPRANREGGAFPRARRTDQTWTTWGPSGGTVETEKKNGIGGPPGAIKLRGPPEAAAPRANRVGGAFPRARRADQTWSAWGPSGGTVETEKKNGIVGPPGAIKLRGPPEAAAPRANRVGGGVSTLETCRSDVGGMGSQWRHRRNRKKKRYRRAPRCHQTPGAAGSGCPALKSRGGGVSTREACAQVVLGGIYTDDSAAQQ
jgi:hypothetical protein